VREVVEAIREFEAAKLALDTALESRHVRPAVRVRVGELGADVVVVCGMLVEVGKTAYKTQQERGAKIMSLLPIGDAEPWEPEFDPRAKERTKEFVALLGSDPSERRFSRYRVLYKSAYLFLRAYHDALAAALLEVRGKRAGHYTSMKDAIRRPQNEDAGKAGRGVGPLAELIDTALPEYRAWFEQWR